MDRFISSKKINLNKLSFSLTVNFFFFFLIHHFKQESTVGEIYPCPWLTFLEIFLMRSYRCTCTSWMKFCPRLNYSLLGKRNKTGSITRCRPRQENIFSFSRVSYYTRIYFLTLTRRKKERNFRKHCLSNLSDLRLDNPSSQV